MAVTRARSAERDDDGERLAVVEAVTSRIEKRLEQLGDRTHAQATNLTIVTGLVERIAEAVDRIETRVGRVEDNQHANRQANAAEHAAVKAEMRGAMAGLETRVDVLETSQAERAGADKAKAGFWRRIDAYAIALISLGGAICAAIIGLAPAIIQFLRGK
jgi:hypothetical protein